MKNPKKTEIIILLMLWVLVLTTFPIALFNQYSLNTSDYLGVAGLTLASIAIYYKPEKSFRSVFAILLLGVFNLLSFVYFFNIVIWFGLSFAETPGIQIVSLLLISVLIIRKPNELALLFQDIFGQTEVEKEQSRSRSIKHFKERFKHLSDSEIEKKLQQDLVSEAYLALKQLKEEREESSLQTDHD